MAGVKYPASLVFGLDIGTRSIVGTVGYKDGDCFYVVAQAVKEHETRAMIDGQIHDIAKVAGTIKEVKAILEEKTKRKLKEVCIAAAGRVLRTEYAYVEKNFEVETTITDEHIYDLDGAGVEKAYAAFNKNLGPDEKFYCVGHSVIRYYMNGNVMTNLENHKAKQIGMDLIATFLPSDVVDGLYTAVEMADLTVANLTLEPIAAIEVAIPEKYRMLNIALVDVGAGTSDICITKDGSIAAYGMIPTAGDCLTEMIAQHCLVDFNVAEEIKRNVTENGVAEYEDIIGLPQSITKDEVLQVLEPEIDKMTAQVAECIMKLNGDKPVSAVFVVGGGGKIEGYTNHLADKIGIQVQRVALRGEEVMQKIIFQDDSLKKDSLLVTPLGICLNFYEQNNNFIFVSFNDERMKLYDNGKLTIVDVVMQAGIPNEALFPRRGAGVTFTLNGKPKTIRGNQGEAAEFYLNGEPADLHSYIHANDIVRLIESTAGEDAVVELGSLAEMKESITVIVDKTPVQFPKFASVNGELRSPAYVVQEGDEIEMLNYYTVPQILEFMDIILDKSKCVNVNNKKADKRTKVYDNFTFDIVKATPPKKKKTTKSKAGSKSAGTESKSGKAGSADSSTNKAENADNDKNANTKVNANKSVTDDVETKADAFADDMSDYLADVEETMAEEESVIETAGTSSANATTNAGTDAEAQEAPKPAAVEMMVMVNGAPITLKGKSSYVFVEVFDYINFDLSHANGRSIVTQLNGRQAQYMEPLTPGDVIEIYWKER